MQGEREKARDQNEGSGQQPPIGNQSAEEIATTGQGSAPPRSMGTRGEEFGHAGDDLEAGQQGQSGTGQADLGTQADSTLAGHTDQQEIDPDQPIDQPGSYAGGLSGRQAAREGEGFILQEGGGSDEDLVERQNFAREGQGAIEGVEGTEGPAPSDVERETGRNQNRDSDVEGSA
jgi:hypothetical protein